MATTDLEVFTNSIGTLGNGTLASDPGTAGTTLTLTTGHGARFPEVLAGHVLRVQCESEVMVVTAHTADADTMTVTRGAEGTTAAAHAAASPVRAVLTAEAQRRWVNAYVLQPRTHKMLTMSIPDPIYSTGAVAPTAGLVYVSRCPVPESMTFSNIHLVVGTSATSQIANVFFGVYSSAGVLLGKTANQATSMTAATGARTFALTAEAGQSLTVPGQPDGWVYAAMVIGTQGTTPVQIRRGSDNATATNFGLVAADKFRAGSSGTAQSALPATITTTALTGQIAYLFGLS